MLLNFGIGEDSRVPWTARRSNQSILKEISPGCSLEGLMLKLKLLYLATSCKQLTHWKRLWCWEGLEAGGEGDGRGWDGWMASPTHGHQSEWTPGVGDGQGGLVCCGSWGRKESDTTEQMNWTELNWIYILYRKIIQSNTLLNTSYFSNLKYNSLYRNWINVSFSNMFVESKNVCCNKYVYHI